MMGRGIIIASRESDLAKRLGKPHIALGLNGFWFVWNGGVFPAAKAISFRDACILARTVNGASEAQ